MMRNAAMPLLTVVILVACVALGWPLNGLQWGALAPGVALLALINWAFIVSPPLKAANSSS